MHALVIGTSVVRTGIVVDTLVVTDTRKAHIIDLVAVSHIHAWLRTVDTFAGLTGRLTVAELVVIAVVRVVAQMLTRSGAVALVIRAGVPVVRAWRPGNQIGSHADARQLPFLQTNIVRAGVAVLALVTGHTRPAIGNGCVHANVHDAGVFGAWIVVVAFGVVDAG
jgi:negative regulator of sigma E activity